VEHSKLESHRKGAKVAEKTSFPLPVRGRQGKNGLRGNKSGSFEGLGFLLSGLSPESKKKDNLCVLCGFAVNQVAKWA